MTIEEIQAELAKLVAGMTDKGVVLPSAMATINDAGDFSIYASCKYDHKTFDGEYYKFFHREPAAAAFASAREYIASLPSPEEATTRGYLARVASAIDYATENSIADEYVTPLRGVTCAMTENLLTDESGDPQ